MSRLRHTVASPQSPADSLTSTWLVDPLRDPSTGDIHWREEMSLVWYGGPAKPWAGEGWDSIHPQVASGWQAGRAKLALLTMQISVATR